MISGELVRTDETEPSLEVKRLGGRNNESEQIGDRGYEQAP